MTSWASVIADSAMVYIDDVRLTEMLEISPAFFYRKMAFYVTNAMPMLNRPPELLRYIQKDMVLPEYGAYGWLSTAESLEAPTEVNTGCVGFELFSCLIREDDDAGNVTFTPYYDAIYDSETGIVTFPVQTEEDVEYSMDFYNDGSFADLTPTMKRLFGLAIACTWDERFSRNWLNIQMKIKDESFQTINESNYIGTVQARLLQNRQTLSDELRKYEQDCAYRHIINPNVPHTRLI